MGIFNKEKFQGNLQKSNYFEGWYFKHVSYNLEKVYAFIPGISLNKADSHAFIQIINGIIGETSYIQYPIDEFSWDKKKLFIKIGNSVFTDSFIALNIVHENIVVKGRIDYSNSINYPKTLLSPSIMGWYSYIPFMECNHGIVSVDHDLSGTLLFNNTEVDFSDGKGYIEKDWGASFPESWVWLHSNSFSTAKTSLFVSIAKIPWLGSYFIGFISFLYVNGVYYKFCTYNNSKIDRLDYHDNVLNINLSNKKYRLIVEAQHKGTGELKAPSLGEMSRRIKESIDSEVKVQLIDNSNKIIFEDKGKRAGLEIIEKIFEYF